MESKSFIKLLRKIIREEVRTAVRSEVKQLLSEQKPDHNKAIKHGMELHNIVSKQRPVKKKKFTKDDMLNDILNETAATGADLGSEWDSMSYNSEMARSFTSPRTPSVAPTTGIDGRAVNMEKEGVQTAVAAMTKDYSALMKAIDKKKGK